MFQNLSTFSHTVFIGRETPRTSQRSKHTKQRTEPLVSIHEFCWPDDPHIYVFLNQNKQATSGFSSFFTAGERTTLWFQYL